MTTIRWTHPSVVRLLDEETIDDPFAWVEHAARELALQAMEQGWEGPPYDSFRLADALGIEVVARQDLEDARLVTAGGKPRIEFNPQRRPVRISSPSRTRSATRFLPTTRTGTGTATWASAARTTGSSKSCATSPPPSCSCQRELSRSARRATWTWFV
jgi:hypothetical protein